MFESTLSSVRGEVATRDTDLSQLRDRVNTLTVTVNGLRKELEVRGQEVAAARREAKNVVRLEVQYCQSYVWLCKTSGVVCTPGWSYSYFAIYLFVV